MKELIKQVLVEASKALVDLGAEEFLIVVWTKERVMRASSMDIPEIKERMESIVRESEPSDVIVLVPVSAADGITLGVPDDTPN